MIEPIDAVQYVMLGESFQKLRFPDNLLASAYKEHVENVMALLSDCRFRTSLTAANQFDQFKLRGRRDTIAEPEASTIQAVANTIGAVLYREAIQRKTLSLESGDVSERLRRLSSRLGAGKKLSDAQKELHSEAIRCIECGAYRAAAVMGWNLAYDYIRQWAFDNRLVDLNKGLAKVCPPKTPIARYEDFFGKDAPNERQVIDALAEKDSGPIVGGKLHDHLVQHLDDRNKYAHASEKVATAYKSNAFIENLIDIITAAPFA